ncbi:gp53-like domain-containing protein [Streptomyces avermitilis]|uniref:gp53-like domain-containing protein n=1 Tax=Streptomyces avermitilis TaxID=33903 RepID=UPI0037F49B9E
MTTNADRLVTAILAKVRQSGLLESGLLRATVSAVNSGGTLTATRGSDTYPKVRLVGVLNRPAVGDTVQIMRTLGGWVCVGRVETSSAPRIQRGQTSVPTTTANAWATAAVTFPVPFANTPTVVATASSGIATAGANLSVAVFNESTTGCTLNVNRGTANATFVNWIATDL